MVLPDRLQDPALVMLFIGGLAAYTTVWDLGDVGVGLMTIFNLMHCTDGRAGIESASGSREMMWT